MTPQALYNSKLISIDQALQLTKSNDNIMFGAGNCAPFSIERRFHEVCAWADHIHVLTASSNEAFPYLVDPSYRDSIHTDILFSTGFDRMGYASGASSYYPSHLNRSAVDWCENYPPDIFYGVCSPMDQDGKLHLGPCLMLESAAIARAKLIVLECNPNIPVVYGETEISIDKIDYIIETDTEFHQLPPTAPDPTLDALGMHIASLIHDGDCLQLGIGAIPDVVADKLTEKHELGIHTEMITGAMARLIQSGVITGKKKNFHPGKHVGVFALGDSNLYSFLDHNEDVEFLPAAYAVDPRIISMNDNMVSINTCFSCDLTGQVSSEALGTRQYSGTGGQVSTVLGASWSKGGRSIIAMRSTAKTKSGVVSNITAVHPSGTVVSLHRNDVDYIVTEYGIARLRGFSIRDRIDQLISIAHPDYRAELRRDAERLHLKY